MSADREREVAGQRSGQRVTASALFLTALISDLGPLTSRRMDSRRGWRLLLLAAPLLSLSGCEWFTDFKRQPHVVTWESLRADSLVVRGSPQGSVPTVGSAMAGFNVSYTALPTTIDSMSGIRNPVPLTEASLANGRKFFQINCAVCHGVNGDGVAPGARFGLIPFPLTSAVTRDRTDGYIFGMIRNGRVSMPSYNRIEERDRWDVVNYVRALQGSVTDIPFERGPLALPGVTGDKVPGVSPLGPTRAIPYRASSGGAR